MILLVLPAYNESARLGYFLNQITSFQDQVQRKIKVIVADDGSSEHEYSLMQTTTEQVRRSITNPLIDLTYERNKYNSGKGAVLRQHFYANDSSYDVIGFADSDGATPFYELLNLLKHLDSHDVDAVIGSRFKCLGKTVNRSYRRFLSGRIFATILSNLFDIPVYDSQCGAKFFKAIMLSDPKIKELCNDKTWLFDTQMIIVGYKLGYRIAEIPVDWADQAGSKIHLLKDAIRMFMGLRSFKARLARSLTGIS